jgi:lactoylglutathione lyase
MNLCWCTIRVKDFEKSKLFYSDFLGLKSEQEFSPHEGMQIAFFSADNDMKVELIYNKDIVIEDKGNSAVSLGISFINYDEMLDKAQKNNMVLSGPMTMGKGMQCFFIQDPNGVEIQIIKEELRMK